MDQETKFSDGAGLPGVSSLPVPSPVCFFLAIEGVQRSPASCVNYQEGRETELCQPFEHCEFCQFWAGIPF